MGNLHWLPARILQTLAYTCFIFFGFRFEPDGIKALNGRFLYVVVIYMLGLVCLGYSVNFVLNT